MFFLVGTHWFRVISVCLVKWRAKTRTTQFWREGTNRKSKGGGGGDGIHNFRPFIKIAKITFKWIYFHKNFAWIWIGDWIRADRKAALNFESIYLIAFDWKCKPQPQREDDERAANRTDFFRGQTRKRREIIKCNLYSYHRWETTARSTIFSAMHNRRDEEPKGKGNISRKPKEQKSKERRRSIRDSVPKLNPEQEYREQKWFSRTRSRIRIWLWHLKHEELRHRLPMGTDQKTENANP